MILCSGSRGVDAGVRDLQSQCKRECNNQKKVCTYTSMDIEHLGKLVELILGWRLSCSAYYMKEEAISNPLWQKGYKGAHYQ
jgi:hypothetical protein